MKFVGFHTSKTAKKNWISTADQKWTSIEIHTVAFGWMVGEATTSQHHGDIMRYSCSFRAFKGSQVIGCPLVNVYITMENHHF